MDRHQLFRYGLLALTVFSLYLSFIVTKPFLITIIMAFVVSFVFYPLYKLLLKKCGPRTSSFIVILVVLLLLVIPLSMLITKLVTEASATYRNFVDADIDLTEVPFLKDLDIVDRAQATLDGIVSQIKDFVVTSTPDVIGEIAGMLLHLFVFFFVMYFANMSGKDWYRMVRDTLPLRPAVKKHIFQDVERVVHGLVYGQFLTAVIQGTAGGLMFFIFGIPNPIFWGFVMIIFSFLPMLGTPVIFLPAALIEIIKGDYVAGFGVLIVGFVILTNLDNFLRPILVSRFAPIHPIVVMVGVLGGLSAFGFAGMILGPLVLALFITLVKDLMSHKKIMEAE